MSYQTGNTKITLETNGYKYQVEMPGSDYASDEMKEAFSRLLVQATYPPSVIESAEEDGHWEWRTDEGV